MFHRIFPGAFSRLLMVSAVAVMPIGTAAAQSAPTPRPPARTAVMPATLPVQAATGPNTAAAAVGTAVSTSTRALGAITPADIEAAMYTGGDLPPGQSALTAKVQILLDRSGISPGVVDGWRGGMSESAIKAFQRRAGLPMTGQMDFVVWDLLHGFSAEEMTTTYTITEEDGMGLVDRIPADYAEKAAMTSQGYTSILERVSEQFHMDEKFLSLLNPGVEFKPGTTVNVTKPAKPIRATVTRIIVDKQTRRVAAYDAKGNMVADYPATVGSSATPSPYGNHVVNAVALNPTYTYNPRINFQQGDNDRVLVVPPGPNGPVGTVWIDLSKPSYGLHGTPTPSQLFVNQSYGCVRLTNWDAWELAHMVKAKVTTVEFLEPGTSIADVTAKPTPDASTLQASSELSNKRPPMRSDRILAQTALSALPAPANVATSAAVDAVTPVAPALATLAPAVDPQAVPPLPEAEPLSDALARAEALADQMLGHQAPSPDTAPQPVVAAPVTDQPLPALDPPGL